MGAWHAVYCHWRCCSVMCQSVTQLRCAKNRLLWSRSLCPYQMAAVHGIQAYNHCPRLICRLCRCYHYGKFWIMSLSLPLSLSLSLSLSLYAWPSTGRSALHVDWSVTTLQASEGESPVLVVACSTQHFRGRPGCLLQGPDFQNFLRKS